MRTRSVTIPWAMAAVMLSAALPVAWGMAAGAVDHDYIRALAAPGKSVLVIEYYDTDRKPVARTGFAAADGFRSRSAVDIAVGSQLTLHLFGVEPCQGEMVNRREGFAGSCDAYARAQLDILLKPAKVIFCRAFLTERDAPLQDVTCFVYTHYPGALDAVTNVEEQLLSIGALRLSRNHVGLPLRPDLEGAERIGRTGYGMWENPGVQAQ